MSRLFLAALCASVAALPAAAETCEETFVRLLVGGNSVGPVKIHVTQQIAGAPASTNWSYQVTPDHWMTEVIEPAGQPWVLAYADVMYTSADKGETWTKLRDIDSAGNADGAKAAMAENAATTRNAVCGEEELDGVTLQTVAADFDMLQNFRTENHHTYWVDPDGFIVKAVYEMKASNFQSVTTQLIERAPDLSLPTPQ